MNLEELDPSGGVLDGMRAGCQLGEPSPLSPFLSPDVPGL